jgi:hypothetical protein
MKLAKPVPHGLTSHPTVEVVQSAEERPLQHAILIFVPIQRSFIEAYLKFLPERAPVTLITYTDKFNVIPMGAIPQILDELEAVPFPENPVPFNEAAAALLTIYNDLFLPCWVKVFIDTPESGSTQSPLLDFIKSKFESEIRFDFTFIGNDDSSLLTDIVHNCPGICRIFPPFEQDGVEATVCSDARRPFALQVMAVFRSGVTYGIEYRPAPFLAQRDLDGCVSIPVLPSPQTSLSVEVTPPDSDAKLRYQSIQCVLRCLRWNPATNRLSRVIRIVTQEFRITSALLPAIESISYPLLFAAYVNDLQRVPMPELRTSVQTLMRGLRPVLAQNKAIRPIILMAFLLKSHPAFSTALWNRLTMGSLMTLAGPSAVVSQFSYSVEVWKDENTFVESGLNVDERKRRGDFIFLVKTFPTAILLSKEGRVAVSPGSKLQKSIDEYREICLPLTVRQLQCKVGDVMELLYVDEEEGLTDWLQAVGLEGMRNDIL